MWMIETASYIDFEDENWSCMFVYEKTMPWGGGVEGEGAGTGRVKIPFASLLYSAVPCFTLLYSAALLCLTLLYSTQVNIPATYRLVAFVTLYRAPLPPDISFGKKKNAIPHPHTHAQ